MTVEQQELQKALAYTRSLMEAQPNEDVHKAVYQSLIRQLRATFRVVSSPEPTYVLSPSRAVLKRVP
jgi:hypothetical protein